MKKDLREILYGVVALCITMSVVLLFGCRSVHVTDSIEVRDTSNVITKVVQDTIHVQATDNTRDESTRSTKKTAILTFDNGTYEASTGRLTGIKTIDWNDEQTEWRLWTESTELTLSRVIEQRDSLDERVHELESERVKDKKPVITQTMARIWVLFSSAFTIAGFIIYICRGWKWLTWLFARNRK